MKVDKKKERDYGNAALEYVRRNQLTQLPTIKPKTPQWTSWRLYFLNHLSFLPYIMQMRENFGDGEMTVPAELPEQFDTSYAAALELKRKLNEKV